ncbi:MAG: hypothetical protein A2V99_06145 [Spirochaetes bacterium RBG_16_67_19]|nr:MAG: hypothetical protein A2V99_06145 [Spirochaetes bacterium RBG_16_67_19]
MKKATSRKARQPGQRRKSGAASRKSGASPRPKTRLAIRRKRAPARAADKAPRRVPRAPARAARVVGARRAAKKASVRKVARRKPAVPRGLQLKPPFEAYRGTKPYIFASYSHRDMREVFAVIKRLADGRYRIWYDEGVEPGNEWPEEVGRALLGSNLFVAFMSPSAIDSRNVRNEINLASSENKNILVVFLQLADLSEGMKLQIGTVQYMNKYEMTEKEFYEKLKKTLDPALRG